jgi:16S rRNA pseudouridine516 synthase
MNIGTRSEVKSYIRKGLIKINQTIIRDSSTKITINEDIVSYNQIPVHYTAFDYFMLHKPAGVLSATTDQRQMTVLDLIDESHVKGLFPVGRLDKDTEGLLLITNDGELAHRLLSPTKHVGKKYFARIEGYVTEEDVKKFSVGLYLDKDFTTLPSILTILHADSISEIEIIIYEGKFHQIKRMFEAVDKKVLYLKRLSMGSLQLDKELAPGKYRRLSEEELYKL